VPGRWEGGLLAGANNTDIATLVERHTRFAMLIKVPSKDTAHRGRCARQARAQAARGATQLAHLGSGQGVGRSQGFHHRHRRRGLLLRSARTLAAGSNENTNGLLRQYFPKGKVLSIYSQAYLNKITQRLNQRPRLTLGFECPEDKLRAVLQ
jgi:IS30 family transposase